MKCVCRSADCTKTGLLSIEWESGSKDAQIAVPYRSVYIDASGAIALIQQLRAFVIAQMDGPR